MIALIGSVGLLVGCAGMVVLWIWQWVIDHGGK